MLDTIGAIEGLLYTEDAQKLYELAWFAPGPVLEIGTYCGQSTAVLAKALAAAGSPHRIVSVDVDGVALAEARRKSRPIDEPSARRAFSRLMRRAEDRKPISTADALAARERGRR